MAYGNDGGLIVIDAVQKTILLSMMTADLYSSADPYTRLPRSPKRPTDAFVVADDCRSPASDQVNNRSFFLLSILLFLLFGVFFVDFWPSLVSYRRQPIPSRF